MIHVVAAVIEDPQSRILLARRPDGVHQGGLWEFPGGKSEPGESVAAALRRELAEELGIEVLTHRPLICVEHHYGDKHVRLDVHRITGYAGQPHGREGQPLAWAAQAELPQYAMPAADRPIVAAVRLPDVYLLTPPAAHEPDRFLDQLESALEAGIRLVQLRVFGQSAADRYSLASRAAALCTTHRATLLINADIELARSVGAQGVHLNTRQLASLEARPEGLDWVGASCHGPGELGRALALGVDFAVLSPVNPTPSHPDAAPLGWERFRQWVDALPLPVYALGGMRRELLEQAWASGAQGVAGIRGFWPGYPQEAP
jgi:8-oxo-dGTP diphosphatase